MTEYKKFLKTLQDDSDLVFEHHPLTGALCIQGWDVEYEPKTKTWTLSDEEDTLEFRTTEELLDFLR